MASRSWIWLCLPILVLVMVASHSKGNLPFAPREGKSVAEVLAAIPKKDRQRLEYFFREAIVMDGLGYVLFGDKPMAFGGYEKAPFPFAGMSALKSALSPRRIQSRNGVEAWRKYEKFFSTPRFVFLYEDTPRDCTVYLVEKSAFVRAVEQHADIFKDVLRREVTGEELLAEAQNRPLATDVLKNNHELLGILLGYGKTSARLFQQRTLLVDEHERASFDAKFHLGDLWAEENKRIEKIFDNIGWINAWITGGHLKNIELLAYPDFLAVKDHPETLALQKHYAQIREIIRKRYASCDFLEVTLQTLTSEVPPE